MYLCAYIVGAALVYHELIDHFYQNLSVLSSKVLQICWYFAEKLLILQKHGMVDAYIASPKDFI